MFSGLPNLFKKTLNLSMIISGHLNDKIIESTDNNNKNLPGVDPRSPFVNMHSFFLFL